MSTTTAKVAPKTGNKQTETVIGSAAASLTKVLSEINKAMDSVPALDNLLQEKSLKIVDVDSKIKDLELEFQQRSAENKFNINLAYKNDQKSFIQSYVQENQLALISADEYNNIKLELSSLKAEFDNNLRKELARQEAILNNSHKKELEIFELKNRTESASNTAELSQKDKEIHFLNEQISSLRKEVDAQRELTAKIAQAGSIGTLNLGQSSK